MTGSNSKCKWKKKGNKWVDATLVGKVFSKDGDVQGYHIIYGGKVHYVSSDEVKINDDE